MKSREKRRELFQLFRAAAPPYDDEVRTGNAMILDPYGRILSESTSIENDMVVADLDPSLRKKCTGSRWITARRPELYQELTQKTGLERNTRNVRFEDH